MPTKFRKNVWIKRGDFCIVEPIEEGDKVKAEIVRILYKDQIRHIKSENSWPFKDQDDKKSEIDLPPSDSEDEDEVISELEPIYESRNIYHSRKLPHVIGTQSFLVSKLLEYIHNTAMPPKSSLFSNGHRAAQKMNLFYYRGFVNHNFKVPPSSKKVHFPSSSILLLAPSN